MARCLLRQLQAGVLLLWDRNFLCYDLVRQVLEQNAQLLAMQRLDSLELRCTKMTDNGLVYLPVSRAAVRSGYDQSCHTSILIAVPSARVRKATTYIKRIAAGMCRRESGCNGSPRKGRNKTAPW